MAPPAAPKLELVEATEEPTDCCFNTASPPVTLPKTTVKAVSPTFSPSQTSIVVEFDPLSDPDVTYTLQWRPHEASWMSGAKSKEVPGSTERIKAEAEPLEPGKTYCVRLLYKDARGEPGSAGPELIVDTEQVGCTPAQKSCCVVQ